MPAYAQRTDLNSSAMTPEYGGVKALADAQRVVPVAPSPTSAPPQIQRPIPGEMGSFTRPTERPNEPITAGAPFGPGPGLEVMPRPVMPEPGSNLDMAERLRAIIAVHPNPNLIALLSSLEAK